MLREQSGSRLRLINAKLCASTRFRFVIPATSGVNRSTGIFLASRRGKSSSRSTQSTSIGGGKNIPVEQFTRSEEHTSELQSLRHLVCRLLLEKKKKLHLTTQTHLS